MMEPNVHIVHVIPPGEESLHLHSHRCECNPMYDSRAVPGIGAAFWYQHFPVFTNTSVPNTIPEWMNDEAG